MKKVLRFYLVAFGYSWGFWLLGIFFLHEMAPELVISIGGMGTVVAVIVYWLFLYNKDQRKEYLKRLVRVKNVSVVYWILAALLPVAVMIAAETIDGLMAARPFVLFDIDKAFIKAGWTYPIFLLFFGPLPEEMAWRGVALDELIKKGELRAQLIVAVLWAAWHIPLFFIEGSYQHTLGPDPASVWLFFINVIFPSLIIGWLYIKSDRSILVAIFYHFMLNLSGEMFVLTAQGEIIKTILTAVVALSLLTHQLMCTKRQRMKPLQ